MLEVIISQLTKKENRSEEAPKTATLAQKKRGRRSFGEQPMVTLAKLHIIASVARKMALASIFGFSIKLGMQGMKIYVFLVKKCDIFIHIAKQ